MGKCVPECVLGEKKCVLGAALGRELQSSIIPGNDGATLLCMYRYEIVGVSDILDSLLVML